MKRALASGIALVSILGFTAGAVAQEPAPPPQPIRDVGRFQQLAIPAGTVTGKYETYDPDEVVSATVVLQGASVAAGQARAETLNRSFDANSAERQVKASQSAVLPGLEAAGATVRSTTQNVLNAATIRVKVKDLAAVAAVPGVVTVHVSYKVYRFNGPSDVYTGVPSVWDGPEGLTGAGMTIGVIDDGIDYYHADFGGSGLASDWQNDTGLVREAGTFPTEKVLGGYDFVGDDYDAASNDPADWVPHPDSDPLGCGEHGTHVSGTAAGYGVLSDGSTFEGPYDADTIDDHAWAVAPGSAPEASIRIYKVFGCEGSVNDDVLLDAIEMAVDDEVDVINMSLGSTWGSADEPLAVAIDAATDAGVLSVVSAGNAGPAAYQVGGPSTANTALSVAAMDSSSTTLPGVSITGAVTLSAQNSNLYDYTGPVTGQLVDVGLGCTDAAFLPAAGKIAIATRGVCTRVERAVHAVNSGALAVIFVNTDAGFPPVEGVISGGELPFVGVPSAAGDLFVVGQTITINGADPIPNPAFSDFASFTSNGPRLIDSAPKPDISAPGVNILSAKVGSGTEGELLSGTSMAAPHTAGIAILVRQAHPTWGPLAVKAAMQGTADADAVGDYDPIRGGTGVVQAFDAVDTQAYLSTPDGRNSLAFGFRQLTGAYVAARSITINNTSTAPITYDMTVELQDDLGTDFAVTISPSTVTVPAGSARSVSISLSLPDPENLPGADFDIGGDLAAISGLVYATPRTASAYELSAVMVLVPYGVSDIRAVGITSPQNNDGPLRTVEAIKLQNSGVHEGYVDTYQWAITDDAGDNGDSRVPDIRDVGVQQYEDLLIFAISTNQRITTHATVEYDLYIDTTNDGEPEFVLVAIDNGLFTAGSPDGLVSSFLLDLNSNLIVNVFNAYAPDNGSVVEAPVALADLGLDEGDPVNFILQAFTVVASLPPDVTGWGTYNPDFPAVSNGDFFTLDAGQSDTLGVMVNSEQAAAQYALGWLVVSVDDTAGTREADRVPLRARQVGRPRG